jgi:hypothetical protein
VVPVGEPGTVGGATEDEDVTGAGLPSSVMLGAWTATGVSPFADSRLWGAAVTPWSSAERMPSQESPTATVVVTAQADRYPIERFTAFPFQ